MSAVAEHIIDEKDHDYTDQEFEKAKGVELPVLVGKIDCVLNQEFCTNQRIMAYPTLRLFVDGKPWQGGDYVGHRTVMEMVEYLKQVEDTHKNEKDPDQNVPRNLELAHMGT